MAAAAAAIAAGVGVAAGVAAAAVADVVGDDGTRDLCSRRVHSLLDYHRHFCPLRHSCAQDENIVLREKEKRDFMFVDFKFMF